MSFLTDECQREYCFKRRERYEIQTRAGDVLAQVEQWNMRTMMLESSRTFQLLKRVVRLRELTAKTRPIQINVVSRKGRTGIANPHSCEKSVELDTSYLVCHTQYAFESTCSYSHQKISCRAQT